MSLPKLTPPAPSEPYIDGIKVVDLAYGPNDDVLVTYALGNLRVVTVSVPWASWVAGEHVGLGRTLAQRLPPATIP